MKENIGFIEIIKKIILVITITLVTIFNTSTVILADEQNFDVPEVVEIIDGIMVTPPLFDGGGNMYGNTDWLNIELAMAYYGTDYEYNQCYKTYNGSIYNYYYSFSDGTRMYFGVR